MEGFLGHLNRPRSRGTHCPESTWSWGSPNWNSSAPHCPSHTPTQSIRKLWGPLLRDLTCPLSAGLFCPPPPPPPQETGGDVSLGDGGGYSPQHRAPSRAGPSDARCPELPGCHVPCWRPSPGFSLLSVFSAEASASSHPPPPPALNAAGEAGFQMQVCHARPLLTPSALSTLARRNSLARVHTRIDQAHGPCGGSLSPVC